MSVDERMKAAAEEFGEKDVDKFQTWLFNDILPTVMEIGDPTEYVMPHFDNPVDELKHYKILEAMYRVKNVELTEALNVKLEDILGE